jgi:hypothetical protein
MLTNLRPIMGAGNGEDIIDNYLNTANPILMPC